MNTKDKKAWQNKPRAVSILKKLLLDLLLSVVAAVLSVLLVSNTVTLWSLDMLWWTLMHLIVVVAAFALCRAYLVSYRSFAIVDFVTLLCGFALVAAAEFLYFALMPIRLLHAVLYLAFFFAAALAVRLVFRLRQELVMHYVHKDDTERILVVGAGAAGAVLIRELTSTNKMKSRPVAIVDDDPAKQGMTIGGVLVAGTTADIKSVAEKYRATE